MSGENRKKEQAKPQQLLYLDACKSWWDDDKPVQINMVAVYNLEAGINEEILYELFCKGNIISQTSHYVQ